MDDFYKNIKDNLENRDEPSFDQQAWKDMEKRLNKKPLGGTPLFGWFWVLPLALGGLFLSNIFFFKKLNEANEKISNIVLRANTIYQTKYVYQYDTIYRQSVETQYVVVTQPNIDFYRPQTLFNNQSSYSQQSNWMNSKQTPLTFSELKYLFDDENKILEGDVNMVDGEVNSGLYVSPLLLSDYTLLENESEYPQLTYLDHPAYQKKKKRPFQKLASNIQPFDFQLGVLGGFAFPLHDQVAETKGYSIGIFGTMSFTDNIRMLAETSYYNVEFKSDAMGESLGIPVIEVPDEDYEFYEASVHQPFLQYVLGLEYILFPKNNWNPYFGVGYTFASMLSYEVSYDFINDIDGLELSIEEKHDRSDLLMNMFLFNAGIEGILSKNMGIQFEGYYRWDGNKEGLLVTDILGIRSKLVYNF